jgi:hypothetical protein
MSGYKLSLVVHEIYLFSGSGFPMKGGKYKNKEKDIGGNSFF